MRIMEFLKEEDGVGVIEVVLILVVLIGLVIIFKKQINQLLNNCSFSRKMQNIFASFAKTYFKNRKRTF